MIEQHNFKLSSTRKNRKRIGRGKSSGQGTYAGRGLKGQKARGNIKLGFEGGQLPIFRRHGHKKGFNNINRVEYQAVNLNRIDKIYKTDQVVNANSLYENGLIESPDTVYKILGHGVLSKPLKIIGSRFSKNAKKIIEEAGGTFEELDPYEKKVRSRKHLRKALVKNKQENSDNSQGQKNQDDTGSVDK
jgi:large subunit ribosomal protein L15